MQDDVTLIFREMAMGDEAAAQELWNRYFERVVRLVRRNLGCVPRREADEEDVALSGLNSFMRAAREGRLDTAADRDEFWALLATFALRKASKHRRRQMTLRRGGGTVRGDSVFVDGRGGGDKIASEPSFDEALVACEEFLEQIDEPLRPVARLKFEGWTNVEIAAKLGVVARTVERKLDRIRKRLTVVED